MSEAGDRHRKEGLAGRAILMVLMLSLASSCAELRQMQQEWPPPQPLLRHGGMNRPEVVTSFSPRPQGNSTPLIGLRSSMPATSSNGWLQNTSGSVPTPAADTADGWRQVSAPRSQQLAGGAWLHQLTVTNGQARAEIEVIVFDSRKCTFRVIDQSQPSAGGGVMTDLMRSAGAIAGVNGGFFDPDFQPLGIMIAGGRRAGRFTTNRLISGSVLTINRESYLVWNSEFLGEKGVTDLVQAGPRLVDSHRAVVGLKRSGPAARTFVANNGKRTWAVGVARSVTLGELGDLLATASLVPGLSVHRALNLDGGNSTAFWARTASGAEIAQPGWSTVRNYLAVVPR